MAPQTPRDIPQAFCDAWMARDADALAALFASDADFVNVVGIWWTDRAAIRRAHDYGLRTFFADSTLRPGRVRVRHLSADHAVIHVRMRLEGQRAPDGGTAGPRQTVFVFVAERAAEGWQVVAAQNTDIVPGAETHVSDAGGFRPQDYRTHR